MCFENNNLYRVVVVVVVVEGVGLGGGVWGEGGGGQWWVGVTGRSLRGGAGGKKP